MNTTVDFLAYLHRLDVKVWVEVRSDDIFNDKNPKLEKMRLRCNAPIGTLTPELRQQLAERKVELLMYLQHNHVFQHSQSIQSVTQSTKPITVPLSFAQQRLWFLDQLSPGNPFYNMPTAIRLQGNLNQTALERSFNEIVRRHAALRTTFRILDGQAVQVIVPEAKISLAVVDLRSVFSAERDTLTQQLALTEAQRPFDLSADALLRLTLLQFDSTEAILLLTLHHIVADGWSLGVLVRELACCYAAFVQGDLPTLPALPIQYADFSEWQREWLQGEVLATYLAYWRQQLQDLPTLDLPTDRRRPAVQTYRGATYPLHCSPTLTQKLVALSQQAGVSLFMLLLAAFQALLHRYTGQTDIAIGSPIANRHRSELEELIGFFVNSLVLRTDLSSNPTFRALLERVRTVALEAYAHQDLPFEKIVEELEPERDLSRNPLFQVAFALQNAPMQTLELPELCLAPVQLESGTTRFDLEVHLWEPAHGLRSLWQSQEGLIGFVAYSTDLFDRDTIGRLVGHFQALLEGVVANPDIRLSNLPLLTPTERQQLFDWNQTHTETLETHLCFHQIFEARAQQFPDAIAVVTESQSLSYQALNDRADCLAQTLRQMGVQPNSLVGLCVERSIEMLVGILGILKAGGAYVPLDPSYPRDRLQFMLTDTQTQILLTQSWLVESLPSSQAKILCLDQNFNQLEYSSDNIISITTLDDLAYIIYTSGSTGTPKGVLIPHRGLSNVVEAQRRLFGVSHESRMLQFSSISFDASVFEIALAFGTGSTLYIPPQSAQLPGTALIQFLQDHAITHALLTPSVLTALPPAELPALQTLITGGEACSSQVIERWAVNRRFFNAYGPTETSIWATVAELYPGDNPLIIGYPVANTQVYILDNDLNLVPVGISGELYIGGKGLAKGYLNRSDLTIAKFISTPFTPPSPPTSQSPTSRLYKTGDLARYRPDGSIEFLGRVDTQIKIRGFRVELGEIEAALQCHPAVQDAVTIAVGESDYLRLIAYFSLNHSHIQRSGLSEALQTQQIQHWQTLYNQTYQPDSDSDFNITGWNSSYTGQPIPVEQMREWLEDRVQQLLDLQPQRILEIGCGTGLLLFQLAPHCQTYYGTDFSTSSLAFIQRRLNSGNLSHVTLLHRTAAAFQGINPASFDLVILNSVVQYFPSVDYLIQVLENAMQTVAPDGVLFIGDVRSLPLLTAFHSWVHFTQADSEMERFRLRQQVERSRFEEPELAIDPAFFYALQSRFPRISQVKIRLARGRSQNEMTQFRYNVLLYLESDLRSGNVSRITELIDWRMNPVTVADVKSRLLENQSEIIGITNVSNDRVNAAARVADWLFSTSQPKTVRKMREALENAAEAIDPQDWWELEAILPYTVEVCWSAQTETGAYDVILIRHGVTPPADLFASPLTQQPPQQVWNHYTNNPLQSQLARQLIPELRQHLAQTLPDYMLPTAFVPLETMPLTVNGKLDRRALPLSDIDALYVIDSSLAKLTPSETKQTPTEITLVEIWKELLRLKQVNVQHNFFELGGHSLLATQMVSRIRDAFGVEISLRSVFEAPTIAQLAPVIDSLRATMPLQAPPLVRLDRIAHRQLRSDVHDSLQSMSESVSQTVHHGVSEFKFSISTVDSSFDWSPLVPLTIGRSESPFFCVHPMFGVVFPYLELAHYLGNHRSFYGLQPQGLDGAYPPLTRIEDMAAYYIQAMQTVQPCGPYYLGGWSFGGLVAFEMAQQLSQTGQQVALLAILDTPAPVASNQPSVGQSLKYLFRTAIWSTLPFLIDYSAIVTNRSKLSYQEWFSRWKWSAITRLIPEESRLRLLDESAVVPLLRIFYANSQAAFRYTPQPYSSQLTLFKTTEPSPLAARTSMLGWEQLASDVQLREVPGNHLSMLKRPHVENLAEQLRQCFL